MPASTSTLFRVLIAVAMIALPAAPAPVRAQDRPPGGVPQGGPYVHKICSASSDDGLTWTRDEGVRLEHASVPCAVAVGDRVFLYYVDADRGPGRFESTGCAVSTDGLRFEKQSFALAGLPSEKALDPCVLRDPAGKFRLYYYACERDPGARGTHPVRVALSDDGFRFADRGEAFRREGLVDPDVFLFKNTWFMYVFGKGNTVIATSRDGFTFEYAQELDLRGFGTVAPVALDDGRLRLYAFEQTKSSGNAFCSFTSKDGTRWTREEGVRLQAERDEQITDPYVIRWKGGWKMYFKTEPRKSGGPGGPGGGAGVPPAPGGEEGPGTGPGASKRPGPEQPGPWDNDVLVYRVTASGAASKVATFERAGVPTVARMGDGRLIAAHQHFPADRDGDFDKVAVRFSKDDGQTWVGPEVIQVEGLPREMRFPFDPTLVALPDGRVRLYFTSTKGRTFEEGMPAIYSAISEDGVRYAFEPGVRFGVEGRVVIDCAVALHAGTFHLFSPDNGRQMGPGGGAGVPPAPGGGDSSDRPKDGVGYHAVSRDGLNFTRVEDVKIEGRRRWLGNAQSNGTRITFYGSGEGTPQPGRPPAGGLWAATSEDGTTWSLAEAPPIGGADPGVVATKDGGLIVIVTGPARPGTPSAKQRGRK